jgi:hypothetical protein
MKFPLPISGLLTLAVLLAAGPALAQDASIARAAELSVAVEVPDAPEIARDGGELAADLRSATDRDRDVADTALVFNNPGTGPAAVGCRGFDARGDYVGGAIVRIPARGLRYLRASDLSNGADFVGSAVCHSTSRLVAEAVLLAPSGATNLRVQQRRLQVRFPVVASY